MHQHRSPSVEKALDYLNNALYTGDFNAHTFLPPMTTLAKSCGVSVVTMWKAISILKQKRVLCGQPGERIRIAAPALFSEHSNPDRSKSETTSPITKKRWQLIKEHIEKTILCGGYTPGGRLPLSKELQHSYGATRTTISKALRALHTDNVITPKGRGYCVRSLSVTQPMTKIVLFLWGAIRGVPGFFQFDLDFLRMLEQECARVHVVLEIIVFSMEDEELVYSHYSESVPCSIPESNSIAGYVYVVSRKDFFKEELLRKICVHKKPVAVFDIGGGWHLPESIASYKLLQIFTSSTHERPGREIGEYLLHKGHQKIAYISPFHKEKWSQNRLEGLQAIFRLASLNKNIVLFTIDQLYVTEELFAKSIMSPVSASFNRHFEVWKKEAADNRNILATLSLTTRMTTECVRLEIQRNVSRLFAAALSDPSITAWVLSNDISALYAHDYLHSHNKLIPNDISILGFDDSTEALQKRITSYNFNIPAIARAVLGHIVHPSEFRIFRRHRRVVVDGFITERGSVRDVRMKK